MNSHNSRIEDSNFKSCSVQDKKKKWVTICANCRKLEDVWVQMRQSLRKSQKTCMTGTMSYSSTHRGVRKLHPPPYHIRAVQELKGPDIVLHVLSVFP
jgi:hypothetical protein